VALPWGGTTPFKSYSAMKFVKCLDQQVPGWLETYNFLCESCHPNSLQHLWLMSAGPSHDNWSNEKFAQHGHELLDRTLSAAEKATKDIAVASCQVFATTLPLIHT